MISNSKRKYAIDYESHLNSILFNKIINQWGILISDPEKMLRFDLSLHSNKYCSGKQVYLEIGEDNKMCQSLPIDAKKGTIVSWIGTQLGNCSFEEFNAEADMVFFRVKSYSGDDFCPKNLSITMKNAKFESDQMNDWVDQSKGGYLRAATKSFDGIEKYDNVSD